MKGAILVISPEPWDAQWVSKHHYAIELARRGHAVLFFGPPSEKKLRLEHVEESGVKLTVVHSPIVAPGMRFMPARLRNLLEARWLHRLEKLVGKKVAVIWLFENSRFFDMSFAGDRLKIYHQVDLNQDFHPEAAAKTADHVFCTSKSIQDRLNTARTDAQIIHHGVSSASFDPSTEATIFPHGQINCAYVGNLSMEYIDRDLILRCVEAFPSILFHFFGGFTKDDPFQRQLANYKNSRLHGKIDAVRILPILGNADLLIVAYKKSHFLDQSNPHKLMEYMMSGKVVVATYTMEYECVHNLLAMCSKDGDYLELFGSVVRNIDAWNTPDLVANRRAYAADNTYSRQLDRIAKALGPRGKLVS